jgi:hypothetical protein
LRFYLKKIISNDKPPVTRRGDVRDLADSYDCFSDNISHYLILAPSINRLSISLSESIIGLTCQDDATPNVSAPMD